MFTKLIYPLDSTCLLQNGQDSGWVGNHYGLKKPRSKTAWFALAIVMLAHIGLVAILQKQTQLTTEETQPKSMRVSMISGQPAANTAAILSSPLKQARQEPVKPKEKVIKPRIIRSFNPVEKLAVKQAKTTQALTPETTKVLPIKAETPGDVVEQGYGKSKSKIDWVKYQAPSFNAGYLHNPAPSYPSVSRRIGEQGRVLLNVMVSANGSTLSVALQTSSGSNRLDEAAIAAVRKWRFVPAKRDGQPVTDSVIVPIKFSLAG